MTAETRDPKMGLELFGGPRLLEPEPRSLSPRQGALVALVFGHGPKGLSRPAVARYLWDADDDARARQRIRQLLHGIHKRSGRRVLRAVGDHLHPDDDDVTTDLDGYRRAVVEGRLLEASRVVVLGFASGLDPVPTRTFEDWIQGKDTAFRHELLEAAGQAWDRARAGGDWSGARDAAEALLTLDPTEVRFVRMVIESRAAVGAVAAAEASYASFVQGLGELAPPAEVEHLMERVRALPGPRDLDDSVASHHDAPMVGRREQLLHGRRALERVAQGSFEFVLISGEAGIGKSRLMEELLREASLAGFRCLESRPVELERRIPLNPLLDALRGPVAAAHIRRLGEPWRAVLAALFPPDAEAPDIGQAPEIQESSLNRRLLDAFSVLLESLAEERRTLLFIDDLQWADATTLAVLQFVQRRWEGGSLGVVATVRRELLAQGSGAERYFADPGDLRVTRIELGELATGDALQLVDHLAEGKIDEEAKLQICKLGGRNPFYLVELSKDYLDGQLHLPELPAETLAVPISLQQLFDARMRHLGPEPTRLVAALAVWARSIRLQDLATVASMELGACAEAVEELARWRLVRVERDHVRMAHELFRSAAYRGLGEARRALLHRVIAEHLSKADEPSPGELAIHFARAGESASAARYARTAAAAALESGAMIEAAYFFRLVTENESDPHLRAHATADLAIALQTGGESARANPLLELAADRLRDVDDADRALRMDIRRVEVLTETGDLSLRDLLERLEAIKYQARDRHDWGALALALDAELRLQHRAANVVAIRDLFRQMRECVASGSPEAACISNTGLAMSVLFGDADEGLAAARAAVDLASTYELPRRHLLNAQSRLIVVLLYRGMLFLPENAQFVKDASEAVKTSGDLFLRAVSELNTGVGCMDAGLLDEAEEALGRVQRTIRSADLQLLRLNLSYNLGELALHQADYHSAAAAFSDALARCGPMMPSYMRELVSAGLGICALQRGRTADARRIEHALHDPPDRWYYDPTVFVWFRALALERHNRRADAIELVREHSEGLERRLVPAWLKLRELEAQLARRLDEPGWRQRARDAFEVAKKLNLSVRASAIETLLITPR